MITLRDVCKTFYREHDHDVQEFRVLDRVSLDIRDGEFVSIIGPSGCGKTTLLRIIDGLIGYDSGEVLVDGVLVDGPGRDRLRGMARRQREEVAREYIALVGLSGFEHHYPHELSGGMQQRAGLARALCVEPKILLMDEPFGSLDAQTRLVLQEDLLRIWDKEHKTVVFITHAMDEAVYLSDRVVIMSSHPGRVAQVLDIPLPRPRAAPAVRQRPEFIALTGHIWDRLRISSPAREPASRS
ncbi:MAG: ABC transporter ATP-binding protein [Deltaproteobacteria bacterium]|nr:ABC transporter ATP-binding protein [Deltaproteobacteria bacterium]